MNIITSIRNYFFPQYDELCQSIAAKLSTATTEIAVLKTQLVTRDAALVNKNTIIATLEAKCDELQHKFHQKHGSYAAVVHKLKMAQELLDGGPVKREPWPVEGYPKAIKGHLVTTVAAAYRQNGSYGVASLLDISADHASVLVSKLRRRGAIALFPYVRADLALVARSDMEEMIKKGKEDVVALARELKVSLGMTRSRVAHMKSELNDPTAV